MSTPLTFSNGILGNLNMSDTGLHNAIHTINIHDDCKTEASYQTHMDILVISTEPALHMGLYTIYPCYQNTFFPRMFI